MPIAAEQPQLNSGQSWLEANLSDTHEFAVSSKIVIRFFSPKALLTRHPEILCLHWLSGRSLTKTTLVKTFHSSPFVGTEEVLHFIFLVISDKSLYLWSFPFGPQKYKRCVFSRSEAVPPHMVIHM